MARTPAAELRSQPTIGEGWVKPRWLERLSATGAAPGAGLNESQRRWTVVGNIDSPDRARVDLRGLVSVDGTPWSIDWWIGAEDRWRIPSREASVRQTVLGAVPVVETRVSVPGGDAVQRVFAARDGSGRDAVVVEIENASKVPFALGISLRPYNAETIGGLHDVAAEGSELRANGRLAALLPSAPRHTAASVGADGDAAEVVFAGSAGGAPPAGATCPDGLATLAVLHPLSHTATFRMVVPLGVEVADPTGLPDVASVVAGWQAHGRSATRIEVPDRRLQEALDASVRHLLVRADRPAAARALDRFGFDQPAATTLLADGATDPMAHDASDRLAALTEHWSVKRDAELAQHLAPRAAALVAALADDRRTERRWLPSRRRSGRQRPSEAGGDAVVAAAARRSDLARLELAAELLDAAGERRAAADVRATRAVTVGAGTRHSSVARTASAQADAGSESDLAVAAAGVLDAHGRSSARATLQRALAELVMSEPGPAKARLSWVLGTASGAWTWPSAFPPGDTIGGLGDGHDLAANALLTLVVRQMLVDDLGDDLALSPVVPDAWLGQGWELHDAPTAHGRLSFAVRWHGERPALLWDLERPAGAGPVRLTAPALDAGWSSTQAKGDALLSPVPVPEREPRRGLSIPVTFEPTRRPAP